MASIFRQTSRDMSRDLSEVPIVLKNVQDVKTQLCAKSGSTTIYTFRNITNKLFSPVKAFDPGRWYASEEVDDKRPLFLPIRVSFSGAHNEKNQKIF